MTAVTTAIGCLHFYVTPKLYRASATIRIEQRSLASVNSDMNPWLDAWASTRYYPTQYRLLRSRGLAERVVRDLGLADRPRPSGAGGDDAESSLAEEARVARVAAGLLGGLDVDPVAGTELVNVSFVSSDPQRAARVTNGFVDAFIDWEIESRAERVTKASQFLSRQVAALSAEIATKETQLQDRSRELDVVTFDARQPGSNLTQARLQTLNGAYSEAISERLAQAARYEELRSTTDSVVAESRAPAMLGELQQQLADLQNRYDQQLEIYKPEWPAMIELKAEIDESSENLARAIADESGKARREAYAELQAAVRRENGLLQQIQKLKSEAIDLTSAANEFAEVQTELGIRRDLLDRLMRQLTETGLSASLSSTGESNIRVVDRALPPTRPFRPSLRRDLLAGVSAGIVLGIALILLVDFLDRTVKNPEQLERLINLPVLAVIPALNASRGHAYDAYGSYGYGRRRKRKGPSAAREEPLEIELLPATKPTFAISEAYRSLRTALLLSSAEEVKVVVVTSATSGEGKTVTSLNLAVVMAQLEMKVLLIDADLRRPRLHKVTQISNRQGLVNLLTGTVRAEELARPTSVRNLLLCPSGPCPPNPSELLTSDRMAEFLEWARSNFDFVIVDSPPVLAVTDAIVTSSLADGALLCFRAGKALREDVRSCRNRLKRAGVHIFGSVLNRFEPTRGSAVGRQYDYYRSYEESSQDSAADSAA